MRATYLIDFNTFISNAHIFTPFKKKHTADADLARYFRLRMSDTREGTSLNKMIRGSSLEENQTQSLENGSGVDLGSKALTVGDVSRFTSPIFK
jgi:hypothetical protein